MLEKDVPLAVRHYPPAGERQLELADPEAPADLDAGHYCAERQADHTEHRRYPEALGFVSKDFGDMGELFVRHRVTFPCCPEEVYVLGDRARHQFEVLAELLSRKR